MVITSVAFVIFDGMERLDIEGPLDVLGWAAKLTGGRLDVRLLSKHGGPVRDQLLDRPVAADGATQGAGAPDLLIVPGGDLPRFKFDEDAALVAEIGRLAAASRLVASVCTGAFLVARTGLADGKRMTTHWHFRDRFREQFPRVSLSTGRYEHDGNLWSSAGISAGIDTALRLVMSVWGDQLGKDIQDVMEYYPEPPFPLP